MKNEKLYLQHTLDAIQKIETYVSVGRDTFFAESHWQDTTIRQLEIIGRRPKRSPERPVPDIRRFLGNASQACEIF